MASIGGGSSWTSEADRKKVSRPCCFVGRQRMSVSFTTRIDDVELVFWLLCIR